MDAAVERVRTEVGPPLILVNNAGMPGFKEFMKITDEKWNRIMEVNLNGPFYFAQAVVGRHGRRRLGPDRQHLLVECPVRSAVHGPLRHVQGRGSSGSRRPWPSSSDPGESPSTPSPPASSTRRCSAARNSGAFSVGRVDETAGRTPVRRAGTPEDIAHACSFLVSDGAGYVTGQVIGVNGGRNT